MIKKGYFTPTILSLASAICLIIPGLLVSTVNAQVNPQSSSTGLVGTIPSPPPSVGPTIATPSSGQTFTSQPVTVSGICPSGLLIKLYINNIFSGSAQCTNGSYSIQTSLFSGTNSLTTIDYDALNQAGPTSNVVTVTYNNSQAGVGPGITLTSSYAKLGADPGQSFSWPIIISGGNSPYALSIDWGDGQAAELVSQAFAGTFNISHTYSEAGIYNITIKATDTAGNVAYLQLVGVANGKINQSTGGASSSNSTSSTTTKKKGINVTDTTILIIAGIVVVVAISTFWLGRKHELERIKEKLDKGESPF